MTGEQRNEIEIFIKQEANVMSMQQVKAVAQVILENHDMLKEMTGSRKQGGERLRQRKRLRRQRGLMQPGAPMPPYTIPVPKKMNCSEKNKEIEIINPGNK